MKININYTPSQMPVAVWFGKIKKDGFIWKNNQLDFEQSRRRTALKKYLRDQEVLGQHLNKWAREAGF